MADRRLWRSAATINVDVRLADPSEEFDNFDVVR
jgi:hypothetical protein